MSLKTTPIVLWRFGLFKVKLNLEQEPGGDYNP